MGASELVVPRLEETSLIGVRGWKWQDYKGERVATAVVEAGDFKSGAGAAMPLVWTVEEANRLGGLLGGGVEVEAENSQNEAIAQVMDLGLPAVVAVHLVINRGMSWEAIEEKYGRGSQTALLGIYGIAGVGKSTLGAIMSLETGYPVVDMVPFEEPGAEFYMAQCQINGLSSESGQEEIIRVIGESRKQWESQPREAVDLGERLDRLCQVFEGGVRPEVIILDLPGMPREGEERQAEIFALFAGASVEKLGVRRPFYFGNWRSRQALVEETAQAARWREGVFRAAIVR